VSEVAVTRVTPAPFGPFNEARDAIVRRLQIAFPPSKFKYADMPADVTPEIWLNMTQANQPFLGMGFIGWTPSSESKLITGVAKFMLFIAVRGDQRTAQSLYYGDAQGSGVLQFAGVAAALLNGAPTPPGSVMVAGINSAIHPAWKQNSAVVALELRVAMAMVTAAMITAPSGLGMFEEMATTWNVPVPNGSVDTYSSDWNNPND
jgi:hypothetical protein